MCYCCGNCRLFSINTLSLLYFYFCPTFLPVGNHLFSSFFVAFCLSMCSFNQNVSFSLLLLAMCVSEANVRVSVPFEIYPHNWHSNPFFPFISIPISLSFTLCARLFIVVVVGVVDSFTAFYSFHITSVTNRFLFV